ncbi:amidase [Leptospira tipperaryensis]|uniref:Amidase n=2 Tax=Leptospira tipperaryensis TaxID=2564040 RepID=A0A1D7V239_9LEPT|nr:amidase [Leptospira tipperaryensis]
MKNSHSKENANFNTHGTISDLSEQIRSGKISPLEVVTKCLERIEKLNSKLNAFITVTAEQALKESELAQNEIQNGNWKGPLHGIPIGIKDMFDTAGVRTTAAFEHFQNRIPKEDAVSVKKLKEAGAIIIGKTNMHELAIGTTSIDSYFGSVHNPWNRKYIAGGSSGGSAAAVASGLCYATLDTDAIGSCRLPAACCGVIGFKPTYGSISLEGVLAGEKADEKILRIAHAAFMSRSVEDAKILMNVLVNRTIEAGKPTDKISKFRIGNVLNFQATPEVRNTFEKIKDVLFSLGHTFQDMEIPIAPNFDSRTMEEDRKGIKNLLFKEVDVLILPTTTESVPKIQSVAKKGPIALSADNTFFCNYYGLPAISIPCGFDTNGLPIGFQIVGAPEGERQVLELAEQYQNVTQWHLRYPK